MEPQVYRGEADHERVLAFVSGRQKWTVLPPYWNSGKTQQGIYITLYEGAPEDHIFWNEGDETHAYLWLSPSEPTHFYHDFSDMKWQLTIHPAHQTDATLRQIASYAEARLRERGRDVPIRTMAYSSDLWRIQQLESLGYRRDRVFNVYMQRTLTGPLPEVETVAGYHLCETSDETYLETRALAADSAFSGVETVSDWGRENARRLLRFDRETGQSHVVMLTPDDEVAAFVHLTFDDVTGLGELPLVATSPTHMRKGLSKTLCVYSARKMQMRGLHTAVVRTQVSNLAAQATYRAAGFEIADLLVSFVKA